ncbi:nitrate reductase associated protein [Telluribacter sp.]|jgi:hypothetical protein|uniref:nitrate reductase associated protein n=1 Tax=Telluribacter sp. TaxID=1978767 RepID=UPI002E11E15F|nr:nitrate reductase associated protein [Telluribacter sp.]
MNAIAIDTYFFRFESDFVDTFRCIPMIVRYKLDTCGIKLKLPEWVKLSVEEKEQLAYLPCHSEAEIAAYRKYLQDLVLRRTGHEASQLPPVEAAWEVLHEVPDEVQQKAVEWECAPLTLEQWLRLDTLHRFALVKLSRSGHEGKNFPRALREFGVG